MDEILQQAAILMRKDMEDKQNRCREVMSLCGEITVARRDQDTIMERKKRGNNIKYGSCRWESGIISERNLHIPNGVLGGGFVFQEACS